MSPVQKALWFVESHSREAISLEAVAAACKVSPYHLTRAEAPTLERYGPEFNGQTGLGGFEIWIAVRG